eukprot:GHVQ01027664.1.p1 GENE.GHVQ01027664.1~~GHVQ01027664.1.p1  ORF type:complete len:178 (-),score=33.54 GHVQ01027664.1:263-796(-)
MCACVCVCHIYVVCMIVRYYGCSCYCQYYMMSCYTAIAAAAFRTEAPCLLTSSSASSSVPLPCNTTHPTLATIDPPDMYPSTDSHHATINNQQLQQPATPGEDISGMDTPEAEPNRTTEVRDDDDETCSSVSSICMETYDNRVIESHSAHLIDVACKLPSNCRTPLANKIVSQRKLG